MYIIGVMIVNTLDNERFAVVVAGQYSSRIVLASLTAITLLLDAGYRVYMMMENKKEITTVI